jgi:hypothetical protein
MPKPPPFGERHVYTVLGIEVFYQEELFFLDVEVDYWLYKEEYETNCPAQIELCSITVKGVTSIGMLDKVRAVIELDLEKFGWIYDELRHV